MMFVETQTSAVADTNISREESLFLKLRGPCVLCGKKEYLPQKAKKNEALFSLHPLRNHWVLCGKKSPQSSLSTQRKWRKKGKKNEEWTVILNLSLWREESLFLKLWGLCVLCGKKEYLPQEAKKNKGISLLHPLRNLWVHCGKKNNHRVHRWHRGKSKRSSWLSFWTASFGEF